MVIRTFVLRWKWTLTTIGLMFAIGTVLYAITGRWDAFLVPWVYMAIAFLRVWDRKRRA